MRRQLPQQSGALPQQRTGELPRQRTSTILPAPVFIHFLSNFLSLSLLFMILRSSAIFLLEKSGNYNKNLIN